MSSGNYPRLTVNRRDDVFALDEPLPARSNVSKRPRAINFDTTTSPESQFTVPTPYIKRNNPQAPTLSQPRRPLTITNGEPSPVDALTIIQTDVNQRALQVFDPYDRQQIANQYQLLLPAPTMQNSIVPKSTTTTTNVIRLETNPMNPSMLQVDWYTPTMDLNEAPSMVVEPSETILYNENYNQYNQTMQSEIPGLDVSLIASSRARPQDDISSTLLLSTTPTRSIPSVKTDKITTKTDDFRCLRCNQVNMSDNLRYHIESLMVQELTHANKNTLQNQWKLPLMTYKTVNENRQFVDSISDTYTIHIHARNMVTLIFETLLSAEPSVIDLHLGFKPSVDWLNLYALISKEDRMKQGPADFALNISLALQSAFLVAVTESSFAPLYRIIVDFLSADNANISLLPTRVQSMMTATIENDVGRYDSTMAKQFIDLRSLLDHVHQWIEFYHKLYTYIIAQLTSLAPIMWRAWMEDARDGTDREVQTMEGNIIPSRFRSMITLNLRLYPDISLDMLNSIVESLLFIPLERGPNFWCSIAGTGVIYERPLCGRCKVYYYFEQVNQRHGMTTDAYDQVMVEKTYWLRTLNLDDDDADDTLSNTTDVIKDLMNQIVIQSPPVMNIASSVPEIYLTTNRTSPWRLSRIERSEINIELNQNDDIRSINNNNDDLTLMNLTFDLFEVGYAGVVTLQSITTRNASTQLIDQAQYGILLSTFRTLPSQTTPSFDVDVYMAPVEKVMIPSWFKNQIKYLLSIHYLIKDNSNSTEVERMMDISQRMINAPLIGNPIIDRTRMTSSQSSSSSPQTMQPSNIVPIQPFLLHQPGWYDDQYIGPLAMRKNQKVWFILPMTLASTTITGANTLSPTLAWDRIQAGVIHDVAFYDPQSSIMSTDGAGRTPVDIPYRLLYGRTRSFTYDFYQSKSQYALVKLDTTHNFTPSIMTPQNQQQQQPTSELMIVPFSWIIDPYVYVMQQFDTSTRRQQQPFSESVWTPIVSLVNLLFPPTITRSTTSNTIVYQLKYPVLTTQEKRLRSMWDTVVSEVSLTLSNQQGVEFLGSLYGYRLASTLRRILYPNTTTSFSSSPSPTTKYSYGVINRQQNASRRTALQHPSRLLSFSNTRSGSNLADNRPSVEMMDQSSMFKTLSPVIWYTPTQQLTRTSPLTRVVALVLCLLHQQSLLRPNINYLRDFFQDSEVTLMFPTLQANDRANFNLYKRLVLFLRYYLSLNLQLAPITILNLVKDYPNLIRASLAIIVLYLFRKSPTLMSTLFPTAPTIVYTTNNPFNQLVDKLYQDTIIDQVTVANGMGTRNFHIPIRNSNSDYLEQTSDTFVQYVDGLVKMQLNSLKPVF